MQLAFETQAELTSRRGLSRLSVGEVFLKMMNFKTNFIRLKMGQMKLGDLLLDFTFILFNFFENG